MTTALITGATSGLGAEFARQLAARGYDLILVGRDIAGLGQRAAELSTTSSARVEILPADLLTAEGSATVVSRLESDEDPVALLVNNAGFGLKGWFTANSIEEERDQLRILVQAPMELTHAALPAMLRRGGGRIINTASVAGFTPRGTYSAAKAWLINFSRWANTFYGPQGVPVCAICPGFVRTRFHSRMGADVTGIKEWMWLEPERVVREGLRDAFAGKAVSVPTKRYKLLSAISATIPDALAMKLSARGR